MKKFFVICGAVGIILFAWAGVFAWKNLRGIGPAVRKAPSEEERPLARGLSSAFNTTGFPLKLPPGFSIGIFAKGLGKPRVIIDDPAGGVLVSIPSQGRVVSLPDENGDGVADRVVTVVRGLNRPHGMSMMCIGGCTLAIAESHRVAVYDYNTQTRQATFRNKLFDLPDGGNHFTRTLLFDPSSERLLVSVGSSCNVCREKDPRRAAILVANQEGTAIEPFATGLRNAVFMAVSPWTGKIWATEMGRDLLGDDLPPDEINVFPAPWEERGVRNYGWPFCYGKNIHDSDFDPSPKAQTPCADTVPSFIDLPAHSAPLGLVFVPNVPACPLSTDSTASGEVWCKDERLAFPKEYWNDLLVAFHGSWNRSEPTGYKVVRFKFDAQGNVLGQEDFITGWLTKDGRTFGRPVDLFINQSGVLYISDDKAGVIYRVTP